MLYLRPFGFGLKGGLGGIAPESLVQLADKGLS
jgi:hypothetical protein